MTDESNAFQKPKLPTPKIPEQYQRLTTPHFSTPSGMLLKSTLQPPPMFGLRGSTIAPKYLPKPVTYQELLADNPYRRPVQQEPVVQTPSIFCDFCERSFRDVEKLDKHKLQTHRELMGIKPRVYTEEEINEWKEARKKRYPTTKNVLARQQAQEERIKRGERLEESKARFGRRQDRRQPVNDNGFQRRDNKGWQNKRSNNPYQNNKKRFVPVIPEQKSPSKEDTETLDGLPKFQGTALLEKYERTRVLKQTTALSCLGSYGSDTESESEEDVEEEVPTPVTVAPDDDLPEETPIVKVDPFTDAEIASTPNHNAPPKEPEPEKASKKRHRKRKHSKDESQVEIPVETTPGVSTTVETVPEASTSVVNPPEKRVVRERPPPRQTRATKQPWFHRYRRYQNTMLEKLLQPEIRHERNVLLQSVRFVVQNNFFGIGTKPTSPSDVKTLDTDKNE